MPVFWKVPFLVVFLFPVILQSAIESPESRPIVKFPFKGLVLAESFSVRRDGKFDIGLFVGKGVWDTGREHLKMYLQDRRLSYRSFFEEDILKGELKQSGVSILIMPGGESKLFLENLGKEGGQIIKEFVEQGGSYLGICAGAFYATSFREGGVTTGPYGIGLLEGTAYDGTALKTDPFIEGIMSFDIFQRGILNGLEKKFRIVLFGGPSFRYTGEESAKKNIQVLARFKKISEPAMIYFNTGKGRVFLSGPHLEIEEDRTDWGPEFFDRDSEWPILDRIFSLFRL